MRESEAIEAALVADFASKMLIAGDVVDVCSF
jgi:hypothetical protein